MGAGIAMNFCVTGIPVKILDQQLSRWHADYNALLQPIKQRVTKGKLSQADVNVSVEVVAHRLKIAEADSVI